jgi:ribosome-binding factor A
MATSERQQRGMSARQRERRRAPGAEPERGSGQRRRRVGEELRHILSQILRDGRCRDPALREANITVSEVRLSPDLRNASVYVMPLGGANAAPIIAGLERSAPFLRALVARELALRNAPALVFVLDPSFDQADRISTLLARPEVERDLHPRAAEGADDDAG